MLDEVASMFSSAKILEFLAPGDIASGQSLHQKQLKKKRKKRTMLFKLWLPSNDNLKKPNREHSIRDKKKSP